MKLAKTLVHVRIGKRIFDHMQTIQLYKSKTATAIIEDALEKGLAWYLKQANAELGYTKEKPLTWEKLAELVKLSVSPKKDDKPTEEEKPQDNQLSHDVTDEELDKELESLNDYMNRKAEEASNHDKNRKP